MREESVTFLECSVFETWGLMVSHPIFSCLQCQVQILPAKVQCLSSDSAAVIAVKRGDDEEEVVIQGIL